MSDPRWEAGLGKSGSLLRQRQPGLEAGEDFRRTQTESNRRVRDAEAATPAAQEPKRAATPASVVTVGTPPPPPPAVIWDRVHKHAESIYGGYIIVGPVHDQSDGDPFRNSGWPVQNATAATINGALGKAYQMLLKVKPSERIAIIILSSGWTENVAVQQPRIDFFGIGQPRLRGQYVVAAAADTSFYDLDFYGTDSTQPCVWYHPVPPAPPLNFLALPQEQMHGCRIWGSQRALYSQRRLYVEGSQFYQTLNVGVVGEIGVVRFETIGGEWGCSKMKDCLVHSYIDGTNAMTTGALPTGVAIEARAMTPGTRSLGGPDGLLFSVHPSSGVILDHCEIKGLCYIEQWMVEHRHCSCLGAIVGIPDVALGTCYVRMRGQPLLDAGGTYGGDAPAVVFFDKTIVHAHVLADVCAWYSGIGIHFGRSYFDFVQSSHRSNWTTPAVQAFMSDNVGIGLGQIVQSPTPAPTWTPGGINWAITTEGDCPVSVSGVRELYTF